MWGWKKFGGECTALHPCLDLGLSFHLGLFLPTAETITVLPPQSPQGIHVRSELSEPIANYVHACLLKVPISMLGLAGDRFISYINI